MINLINFLNYIIFFYFLDYLLSVKIVKFEFVFKTVNCYYINFDKKV